MDTWLASDIFWPLVVIVFLQLCSLAFMGVVLRLFRHVRRKEYELLEKFSAPQGSGSGLLVHKKTPYVVAAYVVCTIGFAVTTIVIVLFQPHIL